jgi:ATP-binding protein involved in chromosome partitioning
MQVYPTDIKRISTNGVEIKWSDGKNISLESKMLRINCPCAVCKEKRGDTSHGKPLSPKKSLLKVIESSIDQEIRLDKIWQVGQYAIGMLWGDGHQTGIYTFDYLRELSDKTSDNN